MNGAPRADRWAKIRRIAREVFDFDAIARRALGHHWEARTSEEQAEFVALFRDMLEHSYLNKLEAYAGEKITFVDESVDGDVAMVRSKVVTTTGTELALDYGMHVRDERWRVRDVLIDGVSLVSSYRSQFDHVIQRESYRALRNRLLNKTSDAALAERRKELL